MFEGYPDLMTVSQVVRALSISRNRINVLIRTKQIASFKVGQTTLIPKKKLIDFVLLSAGENFSSAQDLGKNVGVPALSERS